MVEQHGDAQQIEQRPYPAQHQPVQEDVRECQPAQATTLAAEQQVTVLAHHLEHAVHPAHPLPPEIAEGDGRFGVTDRRRLEAHFVPGSGQADR